MRTRIRSLGICVSVLVGVLAPCVLYAGSTYWQHTAGDPDDWYTASNWTAGVPEAGVEAYIDNGGVATLSGGRAYGGDLYLGYYDTGTLRQDYGSLVLSGYGALRLGYEAGAEGRYELAAGRLQMDGALVVGRSGSGTVRQTGGSISINDRLFVGRYEGSTGTYEMSGSAQACVRMAWIGMSGTGSFNQQNGNLAVTETLALGYGSGSSGTWTLDDGSMRVTDLKIGEYHGVGVLTQTGGRCTVKNGLWLGDRSGSQGTCLLQGGRLDASQIFVGSTGTGRLTQTGGSLSADTLQVVSTGSCELQGGEVEIHAMWDATDAAVDFGGAPVDVNIGAGAFVNFLSTDLLGTGGVTFSAGPDSLCMFPAGFDPEAEFLSFETQGDVYEPGSTLVIPAGSHIALRGDMHDHIQCHGQLTSVSGYDLNLHSGIEVLGEGSAEVSGDLWVDDETSGLSGTGSLVVNDETIGSSGPARFVQTGGTHTVDDDLYLGRYEGATGRLVLSGGTLEAGALHAGYEGAGHFLQTGGQTSCYVGYAAHRTNEPCSIRIEGGEFTALEIEIGDAASLTITGGTVTVQDHSFIARGPCTMTGGELSTVVSQIGGSFYQSGGTHVVSEFLQLGGEYYSYGRYAGRYELSGDALLQAGDMRLGCHGTTMFDHAGGTVDVAGTLHVGYETGLVLYSLAAGDLQCGQLRLGEYGIGRFSQTGGTASTGYLLVGPASTYRIEAGSLAAQGSGLIQGTLDWAGGGGSVSMAGIIDASRGRVLNASGGTFHLGPESLAIFPAGFDPTTAFGTFVGEGLWFPAGERCVIPAGRTVVGRGLIEQPVECAGSLLSDGSGPIEIISGVSVDGGDVNLGTGTVRVTRDDAGISGGHLASAYLDVGYHTRATFTQTGGTVEGPSESDPLRLRIGHGEFSDGTYVLRGGDLNTLDTVCGYVPYSDKAGTAVFVQEGGTHTVGSLSVGTAEDASATYFLKDGTLHANRCYVSDDGDGRFVQEGGTFFIDDAGHSGYGELVVEPRGTVELLGGSFQAEGISDNGLVLQDGGTVTLAHTLGVYSGGRYEVASGTLEAEKVSLVSDGEIVQRGGRVTSAGYMSIGSPDYYHYYGTAAYRLAGGELVADRGVTVAPRYNDGKLALTEPAARMEVSHSLWFGGRGMLEAVPGTAIHMLEADFGNLSTDPEALGDLENLLLIFEGGLDDPMEFEVAGKDLLGQAAGYDLNFALGALTLGEDGPSRLKLVDYEDNQPEWDGDEALYVYELSVGPDAVLDLNGLNLYYGHLTLDRRGTIVGNAHAVPVIPEPATLALLVAGAAAFLLARRRRRTFLVVLTVAGIASAACAAEDTYWQHDPDTPGQWDVDGNWTLGIPGEYDSAYVDNGGTAELTGGQVRIRDLYLGEAGSGTLRQTGARLSIGDNLVLGHETGAYGRYEFAGTYLYVDDAFRVGSYGEGEFIQTGGEIAVDDDLSVGYYGTGLLEQTAGTMQVRDNLILGNSDEADGTYRLSGNAELSVWDAFLVGNSGTGRFEQADTARVDAETLTLGRYAGSDGTWVMSGGALVALVEYVGDEGNGRLTQTGGTNRTQDLYVKAGSLYELTGGSLEIGGFVSVDGVMDFGNGDAVCTIDDSSMADLASATVLNTANASLHIGRNSLLVVAPGFDPYAAFGNFSTEGILHTRGTTLVVPADGGFTGQGAIDDHLVCDGRIDTHQYRSLDLNGGIEMAAPAIVDLGPEGVLTVEDTVSGITGGHLAAYDVYIGRTGKGKFTQTGGEVLPDRLMFLGYETGAEGEYEMHGGTLGNGEGSVQVGYLGSGRFIHAGGLVNPYSVVIAEYTADSFGRYELTGDGAISANGLGVGRQGTGEFVQDGGTVEVDMLSVGYQDTGVGTYQMLRGQLVADELILGYYGQGLFQHQGGRVTVDHQLALGKYGSFGYAQGRYELSGSAELTAPFVVVGDECGGTFIQTGGTHTVGEILYVGCYGGNGLYQLDAGTLTAPEQRIGMPYSDKFPTGAFVQAGGTNITDRLLVGEKGSYTMTGGGLSVGHLWLLEGDLDLGDAALDIEIGDAFVDFSHGTLTGTGSARVTAGPDSLLIFAAGFDPYAEFGSLSGGGVVHQVGSPLVVPSHVHVPAARGTIYDFVRCEGGLAAEEGEGLDLIRGAWVTGGGELDLGEGKLHVDDEVSGIDGGRLVANDLAVGYGAVGRFTQTGGSVELEGEFATLLMAEKRDARGTYVLAGGDLQTYLVSVGGGYDSIGAVVHTGGRLVADHLSLGTYEGALGTYDLTGPAALVVGVLGVGGGEERDEGTHGVFRQNGGSVDVLRLLNLGNNTAGLYELADGRLTADEERINTRSDGGPGVFVQSGGTHWVNEQLWLGAGLYEMQGGSLSADVLRVSDRGPAAGLFRQTGGTVAARTRLEVAADTYDGGCYELHDGMLSAGETFLGGCVAAFTQTGGQHGTGHLAIGEGSTYRMTGGSLTVADSVDNAGLMDFGGTATTLMTGGLVNFGRGSLAGTENLSLFVGEDSLVIFPAGFDPATDLASFVHDGLVHYAGSTLELYRPELGSRSVRGRGTIEDHVYIRYGWLAATTAINLETGLFLKHSSAHAHLGTGALTVRNDISGMDDGTLEAERITVGGDTPGTFTQNGGEATVETNLNLGEGGTYVLGGGELEAEAVKISGYHAPPAFVQTGGEFVVGGTLALGHDYNNTASYTLTGGSLTTSAEKVNSAAEFVQEGGSNRTDDLTLYGAYRLDDGTLSAANERVGLWSDATSFAQTGGAHTVAETFTFRNGAYTMTGGQFSALVEQIGDEDVSSVATFAQSGGLNIAGHLATVRAGVLRLSGGSLHVADSIDNAATIDMAGGPGTIIASGLVNLGRGEFTNTAAGSLVVGPDSLVIFPAGFDPDTDLALFSCAGLTDFADETIEMPAGTGFSGRGTIEDHVHASGTIRATTAIHLADNVTLDGGDVDLGDGTVSATEHDGSITAGRLEARQMNMTAWVGGRPVIDQTGGTVVVREGLTMNGGRYTLADAGTLSVDTVELNGYSTFRQTGGYLSVGTQFWLSNYDQADPSSLSGGVLDARDGTVKVTGNASGMLRVEGEALVIADTLNVIGENYILDAAGGTLRINRMDTAHWPIKEFGGNLQFGHLGGQQAALFEIDAGEVLSVDEELIVGYEAPADLIARGGHLMAGTIRVGHLAGSTGRLEVGRASLTAASLYLGATEGNGLLALTEPKGIVKISEAWVIGAQGALTAVEGTSVHMTGSAFRNLSQDETAVARLANLELVFEGGTDEWSSAEIAGYDRGLVPEGFQENFVLDHLVIGGAQDARLRLLDGWDNGNRGGPGGFDEALYVHDLTLTADSTLDLNDFHLYYDGTFTNLGGTILNGRPVPEPATLSLVAAGLAAVWMRKRRVTK